VRDLAGQRGLSHLARPEDSHDGVLGDQAPDSPDVAFALDAHTLHFRQFLSNFQRTLSFDPGPQFQGDR
jgi:hypothetical protein